MIDIKTLRAEAKRLSKECEDALTLKVTENREYSDVEKTAQDTRFTRLEKIKALLDEQEKIAGLAFSDNAVVLPQETPGKDDFEIAEGADIVVGDKKIDQYKFSKALNNWFLTGQMDRQFATITTATQSGILLPSSVATPEANTTLNVYREALAYYNRPAIVTGDTAVLKIPVMDGTSGGVVAENASSNTENPPSFAESVTLTPTTYQSGTAWLSGLQLGANGFDLISYIQQELEFNKEMGLEAAITAGLMADSGITQTTEFDMTSGATVYASMTALNRSLPKRYDRLKVIVLDGEVIAYLEGITGADGHPILTVDPQNQGLLRFNGTPILRSDSFAGTNGTEDSVLGVVMSLLGFKLRDAGQKQVLRYQESGKPNQTGINLCSYHAYGWSPSAVAKLLV